MALRNIVQRGDELLAKKSREVTEINQRILTTLDDMRETMKAQDGIGIAAPQVGVLRRMFIVEIDDLFIELINPEIVETSGSQCADEGCLSVPGLIGAVERPEYVKVTGLNREGKPVVLEVTGLAATAVCHENDHLDGILFVDKAINVRELTEEDEEES